MLSEPLVVDRLAFPANLLNQLAVVLPTRLAEKQTSVMVATLFIAWTF
jgi:hypothetical protein